MFDELVVWDKNNLCYGDQYLFWTQETKWAIGFACYVDKTRSLYIQYGNRFYSPKDIVKVYKMSFPKGA